MEIGEYGFEKIGEYSLSENGIIVCNGTVQKTIRLSLVYAFIVAGKVVYIGKSIQGYSRPLSYHKNHVMKDVQKGIEKCCFENGVVEVYVRKENLTLRMEGLALNLCEALEQALIKKYKPDWNNHIPSD